MTPKIPTTTFTKVTYPNRIPTTKFTTVTYPNRPKTTKPPPAPKPTYSATTTTTPAASAPAPAPPAPPLSTDPRDSTYWTNVYAHQAGVNNQIAGWNKQITDAQNALPTFNYQDLSTPGGQLLAHQYGVDVLAQQIAAARHGLGGGLSSSLAQRIGDVGQTYANKYTTAQKNYNDLAAKIAEQIGAAQTGEAEYEGQQLSDATDRAAQAAQNNPALGQDTSALDAGGPAPAAGTGAAFPNNARYLAPGAKSPNYGLNPPAAHPNAKWSGTKSPGAGWRGVGGGWYVKG